MKGSRVVGRAGFWAGAVFGFLVPPLCIVCGSKLAPGRKWLCRECRIALALAARPGRREIELDEARRFDVRYCFRYTPEVAGIIAEMKYGDKPGLAAILVPFLRYALAGEVDAGTGVVPVPIHPSKRRERGYNQSGLLAEGLARSCGLRFCDLLSKTRATVSQTRLERHSRLGNVTGSIGAVVPGRFSIEKALVVDDVVTTGSTLRECVRALTARGIKEVSACTVAASL